MRKPGEGSIIGRLSRSVLKKAQYKEQAEFAKRLRKVEGVLLTENIVRRTDGSGEGRLREILEENPDRHEIVMLLAGATDRMTYMQQAMPRMFNFHARDDKGTNESLKKALDAMLEKEGRAGAAEAMFREAREDVKEALKRPMKRVSTVDYMLRRAAEIREGIYDGKFCELIVVRNANRQDVHDVAQIGGQHRTALIHGHGFRSSVVMTDGRVSNHQLEKPESKLRALILDTCGGKSHVREEVEDMGDGIAEQVFGFNRIAEPRDIFATPLRKK